MNFKQYLKTYEGTLSENKWSRLIIAILLVITFMLATMAFSRQTIVTLQPVTLIEDAWVSSNDSSVSYKESWGFYLATLLGNITPANVTFVKERIGPLLSPRIYNDVIQILESQSVQIINDKVSLRFEPRYVEYEETTNKVFVYGHSFIKAVNTEEKRSERTYEFKLRISNYIPTLDFIDLYDAAPKTEAVLEKIQQREAARNAKK